MNDRAVRTLDRDKHAFARVCAPCPVFGTCGGCTLQDLAYPDQLTLKRERLQRALAALDGAPAVPPVVPLEDPWRYRNKAELTFGWADGRVTLGYHAARSYWRVADAEDCRLLPEAAVRAVRAVRDEAERTGLPVYLPKTHQGFFRHLVVRHSRTTDQVLLMLVTAPGPSDAVAAMARAVRARHPEIVSVYWGCTSRAADVAVPDVLTLVDGEVGLADRVGPFNIALHPLSFVQPSSVQADRIYRHVRDVIGPLPQGTAWDLYCGLGLIALYLAGQVGRVFAIDVEPHHLALARRNAEANGVHNIHLHQGRVETLLFDRRYWLHEARPDVIVVDPPRAGLHPDAVSSLLAARPSRIVYCSCNADSLVRDLLELGKAFPRYRVTGLTAFDMFPQTNHVETVAVLDRVGGRTSGSGPGTP